MSILNEYLSPVDFKLRFSVLVNLLQFGKFFKIKSSNLLFLKFKMWQFLSMQQQSSHSKILTVKIITNNSPKIAFQIFYIFSFNLFKNFNKFLLNSQSYSSLSLSIYFPKPHFHFSIITLQLLFKKLEAQRNLEMIKVLMIM